MHINYNMKWIITYQKKKYVPVLLFGMRNWIKDVTNPSKFSKMALENWSDTFSLRADDIVWKP